MSLSNTFASWPTSEFLLRHVVMINYAGKVYVVLRGIELMETADSWIWWLLLVYAICMLLGMYWYTRFWLLPEDLRSFYCSEEHALHKYGPRFIIFGASLFYLVFTILFFFTTYLSFALWNLWCFLNLALSAMLYKKPKKGEAPSLTVPQIKALSF